MTSARTKAFPLAVVLVAALLAPSSIASAQQPDHVSSSEVEELQIRRDALDFSEPIALRAVGGTLIGGSALGALLSVLADGFGRGWQSSLDLGSTSVMWDYTPLHTTVTILAGTFITGLAVLIPGMVIESERGAERRRLTREITEARARAWLP